MESSAIWDSVPTSALTQAVVLDIGGFDRQPTGLPAWRQLSVPPAQDVFATLTAKQCNDRSHPQGTGKGVQPWVGRIAEEKEQADRFKIDQDVRECENRPTEVLGCDNLDQSTGAEVKRGDGQVEFFLALKLHLNF